jgi:hypothetical protein
VKFRLAILSGLDRAWAYAKAALHPYTIARAGIAVIVGIGVLFARGFKYVSAEDKSDLRSKDPVLHNQETARRRWTVLCGIALYIVLTVTVIVKFGHMGIAGLIVVNVVGLFIIGKTGPIMVPVQTARIVGESLIRQAIDDMTLNPAARKGDPSITTQIVTPVHPLHSKKGYEVEVQVHSLGKPDAVLDNVPTLAHKLHRGRTCVFVYQSRNDASRLRLVALRADPWEAPSVPNPLVISPRPFNLWREPVPIGVRPDGSIFSKFLAVAGDGAGILAGGAPRQGKTVFLKNLVVPIILYPYANIHIVDGTAIDFGMLRGIAKTFIGEESMSDMDLLKAATKLSEALKAELNRRKGILLREGAEHLTEELAMKHGLYVEFFMIDELATITAEMMIRHKKEVLYFLEVLQYLVSKGGKFGIHCILATQRPSKNSIPVEIRDMILFRVAFYIGSQSGSIAITGKAGESNRADRLNPDQKGVGIVVNEGQIRPFLIENTDIRGVVRAAAMIRAGVMSARHDERVNVDWPEPIKSIIAIFIESEARRLKSMTIVDELTKRTGERWTPERLAETLRPFGIAPKTVWIVGEENAKGYKREEFENLPKVQTREKSGHFTVTPPNVRGDVDPDDGWPEAAHTEPEPESGED